MLGLVGAAGSAASAQLAPITVSSPLPMTPADERWFECSVGVRQDNKNEVLVMASGAALDGTASFAAYTVVKFVQGVPQISPNRLADCGGGDIWVTPHPSDGTIWFVSLDGLADGGGPKTLAEFEDDEIDAWPSVEECAGGLVVGWKNPGDLTINNLYTHSSDFQDKPALAIGGSPTVTTYLLRQKRPGNCSGQQHESGISTNPQAGPAAWTDYTVEPVPSPPRCDYEGWGVAPVVLDASPLSDGRVVAVLRDQKPQIGGKYNFNRPYVVYSDDGIDWQPDDGFNPIRIGNDPSIEASTTKVTGSGDTPFKVDRRNHAPSIAVDHAPTPDEVYVAFCARAATGSTNTDIYISRSLNADTNISFPGPSNSEFLHLTDALLGITGGDDGADQFVPAIAIDQCGGVNLMFYDNRHDCDGVNASKEWVDVYYARITGFGTTTPSVFQARLTPNPIRVDHLGDNPHDPLFLGDYHNLTVSGDGKTIYAAYIARDAADPEHGRTVCYLHRININCAGPLSDFNGDGEVTQGDADTFAAAWAAGRGEADVDLDWRVEPADLQDFLLTHSRERDGD